MSDDRQESYPPFKVTARPTDIPSRAKFWLAVEVGSDRKVYLRGDVDGRSDALNVGDESLMEFLNSDSPLVRDIELPLPREFSDPFGTYLTLDDNVDVVVTDIGVFSDGMRRWDLNGHDEVCRSVAETKAYYQKHHEGMPPVLLAVLRPVPRTK